MIDIFASAGGAIVWTTGLILYILFSRFDDSPHRALARYFGLMLIGWSFVMLIDSLYFLWQGYAPLAPYFRWYDLEVYQGLRKLLFCVVALVAKFGLINYLLRPKTMTATSMPVAQVVMDWTGAVIAWNHAATDLLGWTETEAMGHLLAELIIPEDLMVRYEGHEMPAREAHAEGLRHFRQTGESPILNTKFPTMALRKEADHTIRIPVEVMVSAHISDRGSTFLGSIFPRSVLLA